MADDGETIANFNSLLALETEGRRLNPAVIGAGVFTALYRHVESSARRSDAKGLRLYVKRSNKRAQQTYAALGMLNPNYQVMEAIFGETKC